MSNWFFGSIQTVNVLPSDLAHGLQAGVERIAHEVRGDNPMAHAEGERWRFKVNTVEMVGVVRGDYMRSDDGRWFLLTNWLSLT